MFMRDDGIGSGCVLDDETRVHARQLGVRSKLIAVELSDQKVHQHLVRACFLCSFWPDRVVGYGMRPVIDQPREGEGPALGRLGERQRRQRCGAVAEQQGAARLPYRLSHEDVPHKEPRKVRGRRRRREVIEQVPQLLLGATPFLEGRQRSPVDAAQPDRGGQGHAAEHKPWIPLCPALEQVRGWQGGACCWQVRVDVDHMDLCRYRRVLCSGRALVLLGAPPFKHVKKLHHGRGRGAERQADCVVGLAPLGGAAGPALAGQDLEPLGCLDLDEGAITWSMVILLACVVCMRFTMENHKIRL